jgi:sigma-B regulation protein RsbU (phosphoserine phosphatase)
MTSRNFLLALLGLLFAWALASQLPYSWWLLYLQAQSGSQVQIAFSEYQFSKTIQEVPEAYKDSGLRAGDELVAIDGAVIDGLEREVRLWYDSKPNDPVTVVVNRHGERHTLTFRRKRHVSDSSEWPLTVIVHTILPITCLLVRFYIAFARPTDPLAWITMAMLASFNQTTVSMTSNLLPSPWREFLLVYQSILGNTWPLWMLLFAFYFPLPFALVKRMPWIGWVLAAPSAAFAALDIYGSFEQLHHIERIAWLARLESQANTAQTVWYVVLVCAFFGCLRYKAIKISSPDARRRMRILVSGCSYALTPSLPVVFSQLHWIPYLPDWLETLCLLMLILFPVTMAYVIVVQRAMDVRMVIRSGVRYAFASHGIRVLRLLITAAVVFGTYQLASEADHQLVSLLIAAGGVLLVFSTRRLSEWMLGWMDKRFFREAYNTEKILTDLISSVAGIRDVRELLETVTKRISESLHVSSIAVFLDRQGSYRPAYAIGAAKRLDALEFKPETKIVQFLKQQRAPSKIYFGDPQSWIHGVPERSSRRCRNWTRRCCSR